MDKPLYAVDLQNARFGIQKIRNSQYVYEYKNVWDPVKKRSKALYRLSVGKIVDGQIKYNEEYLKLHPDLKPGDITIEDGKPVFRGIIKKPLKELFTFKRIDHFVLTTAQPQPMIAFYRALGFDVVEDGERYAIYAPTFKINLHVVGHEIKPNANHPTEGSADFCLEIDSKVNFDDLLVALKDKGLIIELGPVVRHGSKGKMMSIYLRDPDKNLVELSSYQFDETNNA